MDPVDPKRRGRRLFGGRRRHELAAEAEMNESTTTTMPDAPAPGGSPEPHTGAGDGAGTGDWDPPHFASSPPVLNQDRGSAPTADPDGVENADEEPATES